MTQVQTLTMNVSTRYKWFISTPWSCTLLRKKPRKVLGGYLDNYGHRHIGRDVTLFKVKKGK